MKNKQSTKSLGNKKITKWLSAVILMVLVIAGSSIWDNKENWWPTPHSTKSSNIANTTQGPYQLYGKVSHVGDGDTINIYVDGQRQRIRLANIDAPETGGRADRPGQSYADKSRDALAEMVLNKTMTLHCFEKDHYDRHVCNIPLLNGGTANEQMVAKGLAWAYTGSNERYLRDKNLKNVQAQAKKERLGLWQDKKPIAPWTWRYDCWQKKQCD